MEFPSILPHDPPEKIKQIHQKIWGYVIEHGKKPDTPYFANCAACEYAGETCKKCPIDWSFGDKTFEKCTSSGSPYNAWIRSTATEKAEWAKIIRDMPFKHNFTMDFSKAEDKISVVDAKKQTVDEEIFNMLKQESYRRINEPLSN